MTSSETRLNLQTCYFQKKVTFWGTEVRTSPYAFLESNPTMRDWTVWVTAGVLARTFDGKTAAERRREGVLMASWVGNQPSPWAWSLRVCRTRSVTTGEWRSHDEHSYSRVTPSFLGLPYRQPWEGWLWAVDSMLLCSRITLRTALQLLCSISASKEYLDHSTLAIPLPWKLSSQSMLWLHLSRDRELRSSQRSPAWRGRPWTS